MPNIQGQYSQLTANVTIQLQNPGSDRPDNFTIDIYSWDTGSASSVFNRTYATNVTRTTPSAVNGGTLTASPYYEITGITPNDYELKTTASGDCTYSATTDLVPAAVTVFNPASAVITPSSALGNDQVIIYHTGGPNNGQTTAQAVTIADIIMLPFSQIGNYGAYDLSGFTISHEYSRKQVDDSTLYGEFANGPLQTPEISVNNFYSDGQHFSLRGNQISGLTDQPGQCYTRYRITWDLSQNYTFVDLYWDAAGNV